MSENKDWIGSAIKHPGALHDAAAKAGALDSKGHIKDSWLKRHAKGNSTLAHRARLAMILKRLHK